MIILTVFSEESLSICFESPGLFILANVVEPER